MSAAMRPTLQPVPESLEVTKNADPTSSAKTPVKVSSDANKSSRYNYHTPSSTNKVKLCLSQLPAAVQGVHLK